MEAPAPAIEKCKDDACHPGPGGGWVRCSRDATKDGYCWQHHPDAKKARGKKSMLLLEESRKRREALRVAEKQAAYRRARETLAKHRMSFHGGGSSVTIGCRGCDWPRVTMPTPTNMSDILDVHERHLAEKLTAALTGEGETE